MIKGNPYKVDYDLALRAISSSHDRQSVYSQCVKLCLRFTGRRKLYFNSDDLNEWINTYMASAFDRNGRKVNV